MPVESASACGDRFCLWNLLLPVEPASACGGRFCLWRPFAQTLTLYHSSLPTQFPHTLQKVGTPRESMHTGNDQTADKQEGSDG